jgi:ankyrin repeat protein
MRCGLMEVDGYAFCLGVDVLKGFYETHAALQGLIRSVNYLIRGAIFRPKGLGMISQDTIPLGELIDMYHTHEATHRHDKVYALLGMSSDDARKTDLLPNYTVPWQLLFQRLVKFLLSKEVSVETWSDKEMAIIKSSGFVLGTVSTVHRDGSLNDGQGGQVVEVLFNDASKRSAHWTLQPSAKSVMEGDIVCLLQGASKLTIIRLCNDYCTIILIAATPPPTIRTWSESVEWSTFLPTTKSPTRTFHLVWDWENLPEELQGLGRYEETESCLNTATRSLSVALVLGDIGMYRRAEEKFREAMEVWERALRKKRLSMVNSAVGDTALSLTAMRKCDTPSLINGSDLDFMNSYYDQKPILWAAERGLESTVELLLRTGKAGINVKDKNGRSPLSLAAGEGHFTVVDRLLEEKAKVNITATGWNEGRTALQAAAGGGHLAVIERLLEENAEVNAVVVKEYGRTALQAAAEGGYFAVVERLLEENADVNAAAFVDKGRTALQAAAEGGHLEVVERLLEAKADVNAAAAKKYGRTALQAAAERGHLEVVEKLLEEKADVNAAASGWNKGRTALQAAAEAGHLEVVERLLEAKAEVNAAAAEKYGRTALQAAAGRGHLEVVERLLKEKADINAAAAKEDGRTALQAAAEGGHLTVVERLLEEKAEVNAAVGGWSGRTALQAAAEGGHLTVVERLLKEKAEVNAPAAGGLSGKTALQAAAGGGHLAIVERLLEENAEVNAAAARWSGRTALSLAAEGGHLEVVQRLLKEKAKGDTAVGGWSRSTALQTAAKRGHLEVVKLLLEEKMGVNVEAAGGLSEKAVLWAATEGGTLKTLNSLGKQVLRKIHTI